MKDINNTTDEKRPYRKNVNNFPSAHSSIEIHGDYDNALSDVDMEAILDVMGCKTRRDIINLLREEPMFVSEISNALNIGQKAIIEHLRAMEEIGILNSSFKKIVRGRPRKYYDLPNYTDADLGRYKLIHLMEAGGSNTFQYGFYATNDTLFDVGDSFKANKYFFTYNEKFNNRSECPYQITIKEITQEHATISITK